MVNYLDGELHTTLSRIKSKFKKALGDEIAEKYYIQTLPNNIHGIPIEREGIIIVWYFTKQKIDKKLIYS